MDLKLDIENDLAFEGGELVLISGHEAVGQDITTCLKTGRGEWVLDQNVGIPFFEFIFVKNPNRQVINAIIVEAIESRPGIGKVLNMVYDFNPQTRQLRLTDISVQLDDGEVLDYKDLILNI